MWLPREPPLPPAGLVVRGDSARALARRLAEDSERGSCLTGLASDDALVLLGARDALPWVDTAVWVAPEPSLPALWMRTTLRLGVSADLYARALRRRLTAVGPWVILPADQRTWVLPISSAGPLGAAALCAWASR